MNGMCQHADPARMTAIGSRGVLMWGHSREGERMRPRLRLFTGDDDAEGGTALAEPVPRTSTWSDMRATVGPHRHVVAAVSVYLSVAG